MSQQDVHLPEDVAELLARRASREGTTADEVATDALRRFLASDPFEFIGVTDSTDLRAEDADQALRDLDFGQ